MARGSIKQRGTVWYIIVPYTAPDGSYKRKWLRASELGYPNTKRGAEQALALQITDLNQGKPVDPSRMTLAAHLDNWLAGRMTTVRSSTLYNDRLTVHNRIVPYLGATELRALTRTSIRAWHAALLADLQPSTVQRTHQLLITALNAALEDNLIRENVASRVKPPKVERRHPDVWGIEQIETFLHACEDDVYGALWHLLITTGVRRGEALALQWDDVDLPNRRLVVQRTLTKALSGRLTVGPPKTASSFRAIDLSPSSVQSLQAHRERQMFQRQRAGQAWQEQGYVFTNAMGRLLRPASLGNALLRTIGRCSLPPLTMHGLRHTHATWLMSIGVNAKVASERLGHTRVSTTLDLYSHVSETMQRDAADRLETSLGSKSGSNGTTVVSNS